MIDISSETWRDVVEKAKLITDQSRERLEQYDQSFGESQFLRGKIAGMREILALTRPPKNPDEYAKTPEELRPRDRSGI